MEDERRLRQTRALGIIIAALGLFCLGGGVAVLSWRLLKPEEAVLLPPGIDGTPEMTPTPGVLGHPLVPPPLPTNPAQIVILPVSERPTPTPTSVRPDPTGAASPTGTTSRTPTATSTRTPEPLRPTDSPLPAATVTLTPAPTSTPAPTLTPMPTASMIPAIPDRIVIDAIGLDAPVVSVGQHPLTLNGQIYSQWEVPNQRAAGWHQNSAPIGQAGNTVLNGHHNVYGEVFHYLVTLQPGDIVTLESQGKRYFYIVAQTMTLAEEGQPVETRQANARWILPTDDERVTLITCWPYDANTHRLVVIALPLAELGDTAEIP
jgi:LPXTG-site transpeptidase (sortase) family protein